jgi:IclR family KDG regulon transcriptional repressor
VHLVIVNQNEATYIEKVDSARALRLYTRVGKSSPLYLGSGPKLLLAYLPLQKQEKILNESTFYKLTDHSPTNKEALKKELQEIRQNGFTFSIGEQDLETTGISFPIYDFSGTVVAALAVSGLSSHFEGENLEKIKYHTNDTASAISGELGYHSNYHTN